MKMKFLFLIWMVCGICCPAFAVSDAKLAPYVYDDTKQLVTLVEDAATLMEQKGEVAFKDFGVKNSKWFNDKYYLFVYDLDGNCIFHAEQPGLVGKNLISFKDAAERPIVELITAVGRKPDTDASGWVFYLWEIPNHYTPYWKTSYVRKVIMPDGKIYVVGSGFFKMKVEKAFIQERVDMAADLILSVGKEAAFNEIRNPYSTFQILDSSVAVLDEHGNVIVDPSFPIVAQKNIADFHDITGRVVFDEVAKTLQYTDRGWHAFLWSQYENNMPVRMLLYVRKVKVGNEEFFLYGDFYPAKPIWMKV